MAIAFALTNFLLSVTLTDMETFFGPWTEIKVLIMTMIVINIAIIVAIIINLFMIIVSIMVIIMG